MTHSLKPKALATAVFSVLLTAMTTLAVVSCSKKESPVTNDIPGTVTFEMEDDE